MCFKVFPTSFSAHNMHNPIFPYNNIDLKFISPIFPNLFCPCLFHPILTLAYTALSVFLSSVLVRLSFLSIPAFLSISVVPDKPLSNDVYALPYITSSHLPYRFIFHLFYSMLFYFYAKTYLNIYVKPCAFFVSPSSVGKK